MTTLVEGLTSRQLKFYIAKIEGLDVKSVRLGDVESDSDFRHGMWYLSSSGFRREIPAYSSEEDLLQLIIRNKVSVNSTLKDTGNVEYEASVLLKDRTDPTKGVWTIDTSTDKMIAVWRALIKAHFGPTVPQP